jgi:UDP-N-acetyl-D-mannosaminuronic acid dehydrogenase
MNPTPYRRISVIGLGYIGLPTAAMFASRKIEVVGVDVSAHVIDTVNRGSVHIIEPDLEMVVHAAAKEGYLRATATPEPAEAFLIAVPTPCDHHDHTPDLNYIEQASKAVAKVLAPGNLVILESTSPPGTTEMMAAWMAEMRPDLTFPQTHGEASDIRIAYCPERVLPGKVLQELVANSRVIGGMTPRCSAAAAALYKAFVSGECVIASSPRIAEMTKLAENSFRDVNIAFANELSLICDTQNVNVWELIALANRHPRVNILQPGPGVGGHCIAVDPWFLVAAAPAQANLIRTARQVNDHKPAWVLEKVRAVVAQLSTPADTVRIALYGLSFKPDIDDLRESPALDIARALATSHPGPCVIVEPHISTLPSGLGTAALVSFDQAASADVHVMLVDHTVFRQATCPLGHVIDTRGIWNQSPPTIPSKTV